VGELRGRQHQNPLLAGDVQIGQIRLQAKRFLAFRTLAALEGIREDGLPQIGSAIGVDAHDHGELERLLALGTDYRFDMHAGHAFLLFEMAFGSDWLLLFRLPVGFE
jgi:hypothetical protein